MVGCYRPEERDSGSRDSAWRAACQDLFSSASLQTVSLPPPLTHLCAHTTTQTLTRPPTILA